MAIGMEVNKNKYIEEWGAARENLEKTFRFNRRNMAIVLTFGVFVPVVVYKSIISEFHKHDLETGAAPRKFL